MDGRRINAALKKIVALLLEGKSLVFFDECHFYKHGSRIRACYPPEDADPMVLQEPNRKGISIFGAVRISDGSLPTEITEKYSALTFLKVLSLARKVSESIFVLDNALYHYACLIADYAFLTGIDLLFLPPYSPELNPIERVLKLVKKDATHNRYFQLLSDLRTALSDEFSKLFKPNEELRNMCVVTEVVRYISMRFGFS